MDLGLVLGAVTHVPWHYDESKLEEEVFGLESIELYSVGIDIGTTTTHLMISRLVARRSGIDYSSKFHVDDKESVYQSEIALTPFGDDNTIDTERLDELIHQMYAESDYSPADIDTGAVIVTGEASKKENASAIANLFSERAGEFVCATAGPDLEALMAAHGSGAVEHALDIDQDVLHIDIGGGTTKLAYIVDGFVQETASLNIGARLIEFRDDGGTISRIENAGRIIAEHADLDLEVGTVLTEQGRNQFANLLAAVLGRAIAGDFDPPVPELLVTEEPEIPPFEVITFSGGVAEYIYDRDRTSYQDLGPEFGAAILDVVEEVGYDYDELDIGIRATAIGSTEDSVQVSGSTIWISDENVLPLRNIPMVPFVADQYDETEALSRRIRDRLEMYDVDVFAQPFALGFHLHGSPSYEFLSTIVEASIEGWRYVGNEQPLVLAFESDLAMNAGRLASKQIEQDVVSVDGVDLDQFGYIDIGKPVEQTNAVPMTVKSLVFKG